MKHFCCWLLLALPLLALAQQRPGEPLAWEPDFAVQFNEHFRDAEQAPMQVFTCMLDVADLQFRRRTLEDASRWEAERDSLLGYRALYEISLEVRRGEEVLASRYQRFKHETALFEETMPKDGLRWHHFELNLPPGPCQWWVEFVDLNSRHRKTLHGECEVSAPSSEPWELAGVWLLQDADTLEPDPLRARPVRFGSLNERSRGFSVFYELYAHDELHLRLSTRILDQRGRERHSRQLERDYQRGLSRNLLQIPGSELGSGEYTFELLLEQYKDGKLQRSEQRREVFRVNWQHTPGEGVDLDLAVEQLHYVLHGRRYRNMRDAPRGFKQEMFRDFWKKVDPTPDTELNELMREYYRRAAYSDARFGWARYAGWRSDRGRIYMIYGDPDYVERYAGDLEQPAWERWNYEDHGREFLFVDSRGFGEYRQVNSFDQ